MDKDTAIEKLREYYRKPYLRENGTWKSESARTMQENLDKIADFIEEQSRYAELGRLAMSLQGYVCDDDAYGKRDECAQSCALIEFCQKRAELKSSM